MGADARALGAAEPFVPDEPTEDAGDEDAEDVVELHVVANNGDACLYKDKK